ncbi:MAG: nucleoside triphosphate pyrophosphohydrolase [Caulobacteraceae bacterium]
MADAPAIDRLVEIMATLRDPVRGCPWDLEQTFATIAPYTIEEAYEVAAAIDEGDLGHLKEELGDLLLQVVYHARMAEEIGAFDFADVAETISEKMVRRHPHVFAGAEARSAAEQTRAWETIKAGERAGRAATPASLMDDVAANLPALTRALKLSRRAASVGFVWANIGEVMDKLREEVAELEAEIAAGDTVMAGEELGDVLFVCANIARSLGTDPEQALRGANAKFIRRFSFIEARLAEAGESPATSDLARMEVLWLDAKSAERVKSRGEG